MDKPNKIPRNVYFLSLVSFFNDIASEMLYPIMPIFLTQILGAPVYIVGIIDGVAEGVSSFFKPYFGYLSDKLEKRKLFIVSGYGLSATSKFIIAIAYSWPLVFLGRFIDRLGKGIRTGARDALLLELSTEKNKGKIFGLHRSFDSAGAVVGPLIAMYLLHLFPDNIRLILYGAVVPSFFGLLFFFFIKTSKKDFKIKKKTFTLFSSAKNISPHLRFFLLILAIFSLGNSTDSFLILRSQQLGLSLVQILMVYIVYNITYTALSTPAGIIADKIGAKLVFGIGILIYTVVYIGFAINHNPLFVWILFAIYGGFIALTDGVSKSLIGSFVEKEESGMAYGLSQTIMSLFSLLASVIGGILWSTISPAATFLFGAICALSALVLFVFFQKTK